MTSSATTNAQTEPFQTENLCFSAKSVFYPEPFSLTITAEQGYEIHDTLDGSTPTVNSPLYTAPISIADRSAQPNHLSTYTNISSDSAESKAFPPTEAVDKATILRAVAVDAQGNAGMTVTNTYFIDYDEKAAFYNQMKVFSLVADEQNLFDEECGIFVLGKTYDDWKNSTEYDAETPDYAMSANCTVNASDNSLLKLKNSGSFLGNLLNALLENEQFQESFDKARHEIAEVNFEKNHVNAQIDAFSAEYHDAAVATLTRFWSGLYNDNTAEQQFSDEVESVRRFFAARTDYFLKFK